MHSDGDEAISRQSTCSAKALAQPSAFVGVADCAPPGDETREMVEKNAEEFPDRDPLGNDVLGDPDVPAVEGGGRGAGI